VLYIRSLRVQTNKQTNKQPPKHTSTQPSPNHPFIPASHPQFSRIPIPTSISIARAPADVARAASVRGGGACSVRWAVRASLASWLGSGAVGMPKRGCCFAVASWCQVLFQRRVVGVGCWKGWGESWLRGPIVTARHGEARRDDCVDVDVDADVNVGVRVKFEDAQGKAGLCCAELCWEIVSTRLRTTCRR
jgi:hypothetical protein